ncbi:MAG: Stk1 family PASTA domain-containing Ser/Thr kinase [Actinobacteria bacterium]|nr:Stk1 family PASTA domain-containing Ser/Thr kinase [Actinomycetota bacterium]
MIGRVFEERYEVINRVGVGGMAEVYLAHDGHLGRDVALKVLLSKYAGDPQFIERFRREASAAAGLNHPNIVQIYDRGEAEGTYYISMEYLQGRSLKEIIQNYAPLRSDHVIMVASQILEALGFAHRKDVIHRDVKPQNIIVDDEGRVKVTDFGIARAGSASTMTEVGSILGTAHYLSPEQAQGETATAASDLYSLGVVMYEMVTGRLPFKGDNPVAIAIQHVHEPPVPPSQLVSGVPEGLERVILRALAKNPAERYTSAQDFLRDLNRVQEGREVSPAPAFSDQATRVMSGVGGPVSPLEATQVRRTGRSPAPPPEFHEAEPRRGGRWVPWVLLVVFLLVLAGGAYAVVHFMGRDTNTAEVPNLIGLTLEQAKEEAAKVGLRVVQGGASEMSTKYEKDQIVRQDPEEGAKLESGATIKVWISAGKKTASVPNVVGKQQSEAVLAIENAGFQADVRPEASTDTPVDQVMRQEPTGDNEAPVGSKIVIYVSSGPPAGQVEVPNVVGKTEEAAIAELQKAKLIAKVQPVVSDRPKGIVVNQSPKAKLPVAEQSFVTIEVSSGPQMAVVPSVLGLTKEQAQARIESAGLVARITEETAAGYAPGLVYRQNPGPNQQVERGSVVNAFVAKEEATTSTLPPTTLPTTSTTQPTTTLSNEAGE